MRDPNIGKRSAAASAARKASAQARREAKTPLSLWEAADEVRVVAAGVDTLELHTAQPVQQAMVDELEHLKSLAQASPKGERGPTWEAAGQAFEVQRGGGKRGSLLLVSPAMAISVAPYAPKNMPTVTAEVRARHLWQDLDAAAQDAEEVCSVLTMGEVPDVQVSRVDVTADWQGWVPDGAMVDSFVTRARRDAAYRTHRMHSGWSWGGGGTVYGRCYDKTLEIAGTEKVDWVPEVWKRSGVYMKGEPVWRMEFQVRREALRELAPLGFDAGALKTWDGTRERLGDLFSTLSGGWLSMRVPGTAKRRDRWLPDPRWEALRFCAGFGLARDLRAPVDLARVQAETEFRRTLDQLAGYVARGVAERWALSGRSDEAIHDTYDKLFGEICQHLGRKGTSLTEKVEALYEPLLLAARAKNRRMRGESHRAASFLH